MVRANTRDTDETRERSFNSAATVLRVAIWIGLSAGFLDLALLVLRKRLSGDPFFRLSDHFRWVIPAASAALVLFPGLALALIASLRGGRVRLGIVVGVLSFVGFLDCCARLPLELWSGLLFSGGLSVVSARLVRPREKSFLRLVNVTAPLLVGTLLATMLAAFGGRAWAEYRARATLPPAPTHARNVLLIVWDTVRPGNLGLYGYRRATTPSLELLAKRGVRFDQAFATAPWTLPSHASLFTGHWPHELKADWLSPLDEERPTLAEHLGARGYDTGGFVANLDYCSRETGLSRGFAHYEDYPLSLSDTFTRYVGLVSRLDLLTPASVLNRLLSVNGRPAYDLTPRSKEHAKDAAAVNRAFFGWLSWQRPRKRPFFAFLNYNDAHAPYEVPDQSIPAFGLRPESYLDRLILKSWDSLDKLQVSQAHVQMAIDVYDDSIHYLDRQLGLLLKELNERELLDNTLVIVASDHGEHLGDHRLFSHGCSLYRQLVGVPLLIIDHSIVPEGRVVAEPVTLRDIPATVVDLLGLRDGSPFPGQSLARFWDPSKTAASRGAEPLLMEAEKPPGFTNQGREPLARGPMKALVAEGMHYIRRGDGVEELYSLSTDPDETTSVAAFPSAADLLRRLRESLSTRIGKR
jgi:arylsulfatase A-like enzyme